MIQGRRGTLYHVEANDGNAGVIGDIGVRKKFASGRFFFSSAGILNLLAMLVLVVGAVLFLATSTGCPNVPSWYFWLYPMMTLIPAFVTLALFIVFVLGMAEENPDPWIKTALAVTLIEVVAVVIVSVLAITGCNSQETLQNIPGPLGLVGAILLAIGAAALFIMWKLRAEDDSEIPQAPAPAEPTEPRKSLFV